MMRALSMICALALLTGCAVPVELDDVAAAPEPVLEAPVEAEPPVAEDAMPEARIEKASFDLNEITPDCKDGGIGGTGCKID